MPSGAMPGQSVSHLPKILFPLEVIIFYHHRNFSPLLKKFNLTLIIGIFTPPSEFRNP